LRERCSGWFPGSEVETGWHTAGDEKKILLRKTEDIQQALAEIQRRLEEIESDEEKDK